MKRKGPGRSLLTFVSVVLPFALPVGLLVVWLISQCDGQETEPLHILASMNLEGGRTTSFSTIMEDGNEAVWECSRGIFIETGSRVAAGRTVTWQPESGLEDSVTVVITTPTVSDTVRFLPVMPDMVPSMTVSAAYHLSMIERARSMQIAPGVYRVVSRADALSGYDGLVVIIVRTHGDRREAFGLMPGDTLFLNLPLGGTVQATGLDTMEEAMDNSGSIQIVFEPLEETDHGYLAQSEGLPEPPPEPAPSGEEP